jgi:hypothetical protein
MPAIPAAAAPAPAVFRKSLLLIFLLLIVLLSSLFTYSEILKIPAELISPYY